MARLLAIYGSPRRRGNTARLLQQAVKGAREAGAEVHEVVLRDLKMSPCLEVYGCKKTGRCVIRDDFQELSASLLAADGLMLASPIFFYTVSAHVKILMDRCQSLWVRKYWLADAAAQQPVKRRRGLFISVGATRGRRLFDGVLLTVRYFFDVLDMQLWQTLLVRGLDFENDVLRRPELLEEAYAAGRRLALTLAEDNRHRPDQAGAANGGVTGHADHLGR